MSRARPAKSSLAFDINVFIDAVDSRSTFHQEAQYALANENDAPAFISTTMLGTLSTKLIEMKADPRVLEEYIEYIVTPTEEDGLGIEVLDDVPVKDYGITDRNGKHDMEDATVVSLMDTAERLEQAPTVLVTNDKPLTDWCTQHNRVAIPPRQVARLYGQNSEVARLASLQYLARRVLAPIEKPVPELSSPKGRRNYVSRLVSHATEAVHSTEPNPELIEQQKTYRDHYSGITDVVDSWNPDSETMKPQIQQWRRALVGIRSSAESIDELAKTAPDQAVEKFEVLNDKLATHRARIDPGYSRPRDPDAPSRSETYSQRFSDDSQAHTDGHQPGG